jgi:hypothetical protein
MAKKNPRKKTKEKIKPGRELTIAKLGLSMLHDQLFERPTKPGRLKRFHAPST